MLGFLLSFLFWCNTVSLKNVFEVTVKCIRGREIHTFCWTYEKGEGSACWGPIS